MQSNARMTSSLPTHIACLFFALLFMTPCGSIRTSTPSTAAFWHKFCHLFCPYPGGCNPDVYLSLQQKQMLLERQSLLASLQSFPTLLQDSNQLQHTALVTLEKYQRALVLMRYKDFFHPKETLPSATQTLKNIDKVGSLVTTPAEVQKKTQNVEAKSRLKKDPAKYLMGGDLKSESQIRHNGNLTKRNVLIRTDTVDTLDRAHLPHVSNQDNMIGTDDIPISVQNLMAYKWNETNTLQENMNNSFDILKFQQILLSIPDAILFNALCKICAESMAKGNPTRRGRKLLHLILPKNSDIRTEPNVNQQERNKFEFRTQSQLLNSLRRPELTQERDNNYISNAVAYSNLFASSAQGNAPQKSKIKSLLDPKGKKTVIPRLPESANYKSILDQFRLAEEARTQQHTKRRRKRMIMKTQVCPVIQSWSNLVLAKTANGTLVQIAQFPEVNLEQWFLEEKCKNPISPILDDITCEVRDRLVDAVVIPVSNPTQPIQTMKIKIQCCVSMYNLDNKRN